MLYLLFIIHLNDHLLSPQREREREGGSGRAPLTRAAIATFLWIVPYSRRRMCRQGRVWAKTQASPSTGILLNRRLIGWMDSHCSTGTVHCEAHSAQYYLPRHKAARVVKRAVCVMALRTPITGLPSVGGITSHAVQLDPSVKSSVQVKSFYLSEHYTLTSLAWVSFHRADRKSLLMSFHFLKRHESLLKRPPIWNKTQVWG